MGHQKSQRQKGGKKGWADLHLVGLGKNTVHRGKDNLHYHGKKRKKGPKVRSNGSVRFYWRLVTVTGVPQSTRYDNETKGKTGGFAEDRGKTPYEQKLNFPRFQGGDFRGRLGRTETHEQEKGGETQFLPVNQGKQKARNLYREMKKLATVERSVIPRLGRCERTTN